MSGALTKDTTLSIGLIVVVVGGLFWINNTLTSKFATKEALDAQTTVLAHEMRELRRAFERIEAHLAPGILPTSEARLDAVEGRVDRLEAKVE